MLKVQSQNQIWTNKVIKIICMKNHKTSHSLSKLQPKGSEQQINSQKQLKNKLPKRINQTNIQRVGTEKPFSKNHDSAVRNQYYGTAQRITDSKEASEPLISPYKKTMGKITNQIEQKLKRVIENDENDSQAYLQNVVLQQSDADEQFVEKIMENRNFLKEQRKKQNLILPHQKQQKEKKQSKKLSLIQSKISKPAIKPKSKSLLPAINPFTSKLSGFVEQKNYKRYKNRTQRQTTNLSKIQLPPKIHEKHKITQFQQRIQNKKSNQLKLQSRIEELKNRIALRTSGHDLKKTNEDKIPDLSHRKKLARYTSHSVFDNIQQFLSNPQQNKSKSQRKFLKLYEKINQCDGEMERQRKFLRKKIQKIQEKVDNNKSLQQLSINETNQSENPLKQIKQISTESSPPDQTDSQYGATEWRRMGKYKINKSSFDNEIKYIKSLEQMSKQNLIKHIQNQKILYELRLIKRTQIMLNKTNKNVKSYTNLDDYTSM